MIFQNFIACCNRLRNSTSVNSFIVPILSARVFLSVCFQPCYLSFPERRSNPASARGTPRSPPSVANTQSWLEHLFQPLAPSPLGCCFLSFFFHNSCQKISGEMSEAGVCWGRRGGGGWRGRGGGEGIHLIPGSRCIY